MTEKLLNEFLFTENMKMKFFNISEHDIGKRKYNIFIGVSIGVLKPLTGEIIKEYIRWALKYSKGSVAILIADEITKFNYKIFGQYSTGKSERRAIKEGETCSQFIKSILTDFSKKEQERIIILKWKNIWNERKEKIRQILEYEYRHNNFFRSKIHFFINKYSNKRGKKLDTEKLDYLSQYILYELPTLLDGIEYNDVKYSILLYPTFEHSGMSEFVIEVKKGANFPSLNDKLKMVNNTGMVEAYIPI